MDWIDITGLLVIIIGLLVFVPILSYFWYQFSSYVIHTESAKYHNKKIVQYMNILCIISLVIERPFVIICNVFNNKQSVINVPLWIVYTADCIIIWSIFVLFTIKSWTLYYNFQYHISLTKLIWKKEINARYRSWFIQHKNTYGNVDYCIRIVIIPLILFITFESLIEYFFLQNIFIHSMTILTLIIMIPSFVLYMKLKVRLFTDIYGIKNEIIYQQRTIFMLIFVISCNFILRIILYHKHKQNIIYLNRIFYLMDTICASIVSFLIPFISVLNPYQLQMIHADENLKYLQQVVTESSSASGVNNHAIGIKDMLKCIAGHNGFQDFMAHLVREFATENLLFVCEYVQIKYELQTVNKGLIKILKPQYFNHTINESINECDKFITIDFNAYKMTQFDHKSERKSVFLLDTIPHLKPVSSVRTSEGAMTCLLTSNGEIATMVKLPAGLPKSEIINESKQFTDRLYKLYLKYIQIGSIHEVNICHQQRQSLKNIFENYALNKSKKDNKSVEMDEKCELESMECGMFNVFDVACLELLSLMSHSYTRFAKHKNDNKMSELSNVNTNINIAQIRNGLSYSQLKEVYQIV